MCTLYQVNILLKCIRETSFVQKPQRQLYQSDDPQPCEWPEAPSVITDEPLDSGF